MSMASRVSASPRPAVSPRAASPDSICRSPSRRIASVRSAGSPPSSSRKSRYSALARSGSGATVSPVRTSGAARFRSLSVGGGLGLAASAASGSSASRTAAKESRGSRRRLRGPGRRRGRRAVVDRRERVARLHRILVQALALLLELAHGNVGEVAALRAPWRPRPAPRAPRCAATRASTRRPRAAFFSGAPSRARPEAVSRVRAS